MANSSETCDEEHELQLITEVSVTANCTTDDQQVSAIKGRKSSVDTIGLAVFRLARDEQGALIGVTCPEGQAAEIRVGRKTGHYSVGFCASLGEGCPLSGQWAAKPLKNRNVRILRINLKDLQAALRRQQVAETGKEVVNRRASVEATVRSVVHPFGGHLCKLPGRGKSRVTTMIVQRAAMVTIRRIAEHLCPQVPKTRISEPILQC